MKRVHILHEPVYSANGAAFLFPLYFYRTQMARNYGIQLKWITHISPALFDCEVLCISNRFFRSWWTKERKDHIFAFLKEAKQKVPRVIWFDISDSTGTTQFQVLPYVDRYCKGQVLRERSAYRKTYYGSRIFSDFYHRTLGGEDCDPGAPHLNHIPSEDELKKVTVSWNSGLAHYGYWGMRLNKLWFQFPRMPHFYPHRWKSPFLNRSLPISCRVGTTYARHTVGSSREEIRKRLGDVVPFEKVSRRKYFKEMATSRAVISPFGLGEITLRDFEAVLCGAAIVKQNMDHLDTWPNLWENDTMYIPFAWDFSDLDMGIAFIQNQPQKVADRAHVAQERYKKIVMNEDGQRAFCNRFVNIVSVF